MAATDGAGPLRAPFGCPGLLQHNPLYNPDAEEDAGAGLQMGAAGRPLVVLGPAPGVADESDPEQGETADHSGGEELSDRELRTRARMDARNPQKRPRRNSLLYSPFRWNLLYDVFTVIIGVADIVSDVIVTYQFWFYSKTFFGLSLTLLLMAQVCYVCYFLIIFSNPEREMRWRTRVLHFLFALCFGQLVPLFVWFNTFHFKWWDSLLRRCYLEPEPYSEKPRAEQQALKDPFKAYLERKLKAHGGFIIESFVEGIPQSVIQLVAITMLGQYSYINVFSLTMSLLSISSKALISSYSLVTKVIAFNFLCIMHDVVCLFCTVCWLFLPSPTVPYPVFFVPANNSILTAIWLWAQFVAICALVTLLLCSLFAKVCQAESWRQRRHSEAYYLFMGVLYIIAGSLGCTVTFVVLQNFKLFALPFIWPERTISGNAHALLKPLYNWIVDRDSKRRLRIVNTFLYAHQVAERCHDPQFEFIVKEPDLYSHQYIRELKGWQANQVARKILEEIGPYKDVRFDVAVFNFLVLPILLLVMLYSIAYPVASFIYYLSLGYPVPLLHKVISSIHCAVVILLMWFTPATIAYRSARLHTVLPDLDVVVMKFEETAWVKAIKDKYHEVVTTGVDDVTQWAMRYHLARALEKNRTPYQGKVFIRNDDAEIWQVAGMAIPAGVLRPRETFQQQREYQLPRRRSLGGSVWRNYPERSFIEAPPPHPAQIDNNGANGGRQNARLNEPQPAAPRPAEANNNDLPANRPAPAVIVPLLAPLIIAPVPKAIAGPTVNVGTASSPKASSPTASTSKDTPSSDAPVATSNVTNDMGKPSLVAGAESPSAAVPTPTTASGRSDDFAFEVQEIDRSARVSALRAEVAEVARMQVTTPPAKNPENSV